MVVTGPYWCQFNNGSGNGLVPSGNKPLPKPMLSHIYVAIWGNELICLDCRTSSEIETRYLTFHDHERQWPHIWIRYMCIDITTFWCLFIIFIKSLKLHWRCDVQYSCKIKVFTDIPTNSRLTLYTDLDFLQPFHYQTNSASMHDHWYGYLDILSYL